MGCFHRTDSFDDFTVYAPIACNPTPTPTPSPTPTQSLPTMTPILDLFCQSTITADVFNVEIDGSLTYDGPPLADQLIQLAYSVTNGDSWEELTLVKTQADGSFIALWKPSVTGYYLVKATYEGTQNLSETSKTVTLALTPDIDHNVFSLSANSTITQFNFNAETQNLTFTAEGPSGTKGYVHLEIPKKIFSDISTLKAYIGNKEITFSSQSLSDYWLISFSYSHSTHTITMSLADQVQPDFAIPALLLVAVAAVVVAVVATALVATRRRHTNPPPP